MLEREYPQGNEEGKNLFHRLLQYDGAGCYNDDFLEALIAYRALYPQSEKFDLFYAKYAMAYHNYDVALESLIKAERLRPLNMELWRGFVRCFQAIGREREALLYMALLYRFYAEPLQFSVSRDDLPAYLRQLSQAMCIGNYAPFWTYAIREGQEGQAPSKTMQTVGGDFIPSLINNDRLAYWVGAYVCEEPLDAKGWLLSRCKDDETFVQRCGAEFVFDIMRSREVEKECEIDEDVPVILPVAGTAIRQRVDFTNTAVNAPVWLGKWEYSFFRVEEKTKLISEQPFVIGEPIPLIHSPKRKKLILQILVDGLCWRQVRQEGYRLMPNVMKFFSKGVIFDEHYSVSEYTYPSLATIETGMYPEHSQIFNVQTSRPLASEFLTISEQLKSLGYYCCSPASCGTGIYNGVTRGFDRLVVNSYALFMYEAVERLIRQIEAFGECDQALSVQVLDTHAWAAHGNYVPVVSQTQLCLSDRLALSESVASVYLPHTPLYQHSNRQGIMQADRALGVLFDYLEGHFAEDEYLIFLYSDHGMSVYDEIPWILSEKQVGAAFMVRGAGVPVLGTVEELTSALDIYPSMAKYAGFSVGDWVDGNLPQAFGGKEREYVISESVFPGQTYKMCVRTKTHEFRLETIEKVDEDGTVDISGAKTKLFRRDNRESEGLDSSLWAYFFSIVKEHTVSFNNEGHFWPEMRKARADWFNAADGGKS